MGRSYPVAKRVAQLEMRRRSGRPVVVFSMGKTGSTAIANAVSTAARSTAGRSSAFQVFRLDPLGLAAAEARYRERERALRVRQPHPKFAHRGSAPFPGALHLWESDFLLRHPPSPAAPWDVITTVREPVAQAVSAFFHGSDRRGSLAEKPTPDELIDRLDDERWLQHPLRWFDREFAPALGIDVFDRSFDTERGYEFVETPAVRVLILRQESFDAAPLALQTFLGTSEPIAIARQNVGAQKDYAAPYRAFLERATFSGEILQRVYESRFARHFYSADELERFEQRWRGNRPTPA